MFIKIGNSDYVNLASVDRIDGAFAVMRNGGRVKLSRDFDVDHLVPATVIKAEPGFEVLWLTCNDEVSRLPVIAWRVCIYNGDNGDPEPVTPTHCCDIKLLDRWGIKWPDGQVHDYDDDIYENEAAWLKATRDRVSAEAE